MPAGMPGRRTGAFIRVHLWKAHFYLPSARCCTTDFDLQRHLQQFYPPFMRFVTRSRLRPLFYVPASQLLASVLSYFQSSSLKGNANLTVAKQEIGALHFLLSHGILRFSESRQSSEGLPRLRKNAGTTVEAGGF